MPEMWDENECIPCVLYILVLLPKYTKQLLSCESALVEAKISLTLPLCKQASFYFVRGSQQALVMTSVAEEYCEGRQTDSTMTTHSSRKTLKKATLNVNIAINHPILHHKVYRRVRCFSLYTLNIIIKIILICFCFCFLSLSKRINGRGWRVRCVFMCAIACRTSTHPHTLRHGILAYYMKYIKHFN